MIKLFEQYKEYDQVKRWLDKMFIDSYVINDDLTVDVYGDVLLGGNNLRSIPIKFGKVHGDFIIQYNKLKTLKGCPEYVGKGFYCSHNNLKSLEYCPKKIGGDFYCSNNLITSLEYCPEHIFGNFGCVDNLISTLNYCPKKIDGNFNIKHNKLTSLLNFPTVKGSINLDYNNLPTEVLILPKEVIIDRMYEYGIWNSDGTFNKGRWDIFRKEYESEQIRN